MNLPYCLHIFYITEIKRIHCFAILTSNTVIERIVQSPLHDETFYLYAFTLDKKIVIAER